MGPLDKYILADDALRSHAKGFELAVQSHWYRSLPLSCMQLALTLNGLPIDPGSMRVKANGKTFPYDELSELYDEYLFVTDKAILEVEHMPLRQGDTYEVALDYGLLIPYILVGSTGKPLLALSQVSKRLICQ